VLRDGRQDAVADGQAHDLRRGHRRPERRGGHLHHPHGRAGSADHGRRARARRDRGATRVTFEGTVEGVFIAPDASATMRPVERVQAVAGRGLEGDRYFLRRGTYSATPGTGREVTLIEAEAVESWGLESGIVMEPGQARRNIVTRGVPLNHLVGREF